MDLRKPGRAPVELGMPRHPLSKYQEPLVGMPEPPKIHDHDMTAVHLPSSPHFGVQQLQNRLRRGGLAAAS